MKRVNDKRGKKSMIYISPPTVRVLIGTKPTPRKYRPSETNGGIGGKDVESSIHDGSTKLGMVFEC